MLHEVIGFNILFLLQVKNRSDALLRPAKGVLQTAVINKSTYVSMHRRSDIFARTAINHILMRAPSENMQR